MKKINALVIKEICHFIKIKCSLMNEGNFKDLSEMIISDVDSIESKLHQPTVMRSKLMADAQKKREDECGDHYFIEDGKWSSTRTCQDCGKRI